MRGLNLPLPCPTLLCKMEEFFLAKNRKKKGYLQNLLDNGKDCKSLPVFRIPSIGPTTSTQQTLKAFL
jgi:hypothetical protein